MDGRPWPRLARVIAVHPEAHTVDVEYLRDLGVAHHVPVMMGPVSTNTGLADLPVPAGGMGSGYTGERDMTAIVDLVDGIPVVMGFLHQRVTQMLFADPERRVDRHASDVYTTIDRDGNYELYHPSGTYIRVGVTPAHEDLTGKDYDKKWRITKNTDKAVHLHVALANAGATKATLDIDPQGNITIDTRGALAGTIDGNVTVNTHGTLIGTVDGDTTLTTPTVTLNTQELLVTGDITANGSIMAIGPITSNGPIKDSAASGGMSMDEMRTVYNAHTHPGDSGGTTGAPNQSM